MGRSVDIDSGTHKITFARVKQVGITISVPEQGAGTSIEPCSTAGNNWVWLFDTM
jgi:hypothetical protein